MDIYDRIDNELKKRHMSRRQLAMAAGIPESTFASAFSRRSKYFPYERLLSVANALNIPIYALIPMEDFTEFEHNAISELMGTTDSIPFWDSEDELSQNLGRIGTAAMFTQQSDLMWQAFYKRPIMTENRIFSELNGLFSRLDLQGQIKVLEYIRDIMPRYQKKAKGESACPGDAPSTEAEASDSEKMDDGKRS